MPQQGQSSLSDKLRTEIPCLRAYARLMTNDVSVADRGVVETLQHALCDIERLRIRKALRSYLLMILRDILVASETAQGKSKALSAVYDRLKGPFRIENGHLERPISLATALLRLTFEDREAVVLRAGLRLSRMEAAAITGCELPVYDRRVRRGLTQLAELLPQKALAKALGDAMDCRAFSGVNKALELQEMLLH